MKNYKQAKLFLSYAHTKFRGIAYDFRLQLIIGIILFIT